MKSGRLKITNDSRYPDDEVERLVEIGLQDLDVPRSVVHVLVKDTQRSSRRRSGWIPYSGVAKYPLQVGQYHVIIRIGPPECFPIKPFRRDGWVHDYRTWDETLLGVTAHEGRHVQHYYDGAYAWDRGVEAKATAAEAGALNRYRLEGGTMDTVADTSDKVAERKAKKAAADKARRERIKAEKQAAATEPLLVPAPTFAVPGDPNWIEPGQLPAKHVHTNDPAKKGWPSNWKETKPTGLTGLLRTYWNRKRKTWVSVYDGKATGMDTAGGRWQVVCERHSTINSVDTAKQAMVDAQNDPAEFCEQCR